MRKLRLYDLPKFNRFLHEVDRLTYELHTDGVSSADLRNKCLLIATKGENKGNFIYNWADMCLILDDIKRGVDVDKYSVLDENDKPVYNYGMRKQISLGLRKNLDVDKYMVLNDKGEPIYQSDEMDAIREGLEHNVDVDKYMGLNADGKPIYDSWQMSVMEDCLSGRYTTDINEINGLDENGKPLYESCMMKAIIACDQAGVGTDEIKSYLLETDKNGKRIFDDYRIVELLAVSTIVGVDTKTWAERYKSGMPFDEFIDDYKYAIRKYGFQDMFDKIDMYNVNEFKSSRPSFLSTPTMPVGYAFSESGTGKAKVANRVSLLVPYVKSDERIVKPVKYGFDVDSLVAKGEKIGQMTTAEMPKGEQLE